MVPVGCEELNSLLGDWPEDIITQTDKRFKAVMDSGFYAVDSLPVELTWIPDSNPTRDSVLPEMNSEFHDFLFGIQDATSKNFSDSGIGYSGRNSG